MIDASRSAPAVVKLKRPAKSVACAMLTCGFLPSSRIERRVRVALSTHRQTIGIGIEKRLRLTLQTVPMTIYGTDAKRVDRKCAQI